MTGGKTTEGPQPGAARKTMKKYDGKRLLMLGSNAMSCEIVEYARRNGAHVAVTDFLPIEKSPAKQLADEALFISTADIDALTEYGRRESIDGVFAGISEFNLIQARKLSEALGLRYYCDENQWDLIERKDRFKALCLEYGVQTPKEWFSGTATEFERFDKAALRYPLVVKPVDGSASQGVTICEGEEALTRAAANAFEVSASQKIIIEAFAQGHEFTAHYTVCGGKAALACVDNRYPAALHPGSVTTIPIARVYPALFQKRFVRTVTPRLTALCEGIGLDTAILFFQGLYDERKDAFTIFEAGLRSAAESPCRFLERITGQNQVYLLLDYILLGASSYDLGLEKPDLNGKCCAVVSFASAGGVVAEIRGLEEVQSLPEVIRVENRYPVGSAVPNGDTLRQIMLRFVILTESREALARTIERINAAVHATDIQGNEMLIGMEPERVFGLL